MRAIFKPDEPTKLIVRDADVNEISLIQYYMNKVKSGGTLTADTRYDLNDKPAGILFTVGDAKPTVDPVYLEVDIEKVVNDGSIVSFVLDIKTENVVPYMINNEVWEEVKHSLEKLGLIGVDIVSFNRESVSDYKINIDARITAINPIGRPINGVIEAPDSLIRYVDRDTNTTNFYSKRFVVELSE